MHLAYFRKSQEADFLSFTTGPLLTQQNTVTGKRLPRCPQAPPPASESSLLRGSEDGLWGQRDLDSNLDFDVPTSFGQLNLLSFSFCICLGITFVSWGCCWQLRWPIRSRYRPGTYSVLSKCQVRFLLILLYRNLANLPKRREHGEMEKELFSFCVNYPTATKE